MKDREGFNANSIKDVSNKAELVHEVVMLVEDFRKRQQSWFEERIQRMNKSTGVNISESLKQLASNVHEANRLKTVKEGVSPQ